MDKSVEQANIPSGVHRYAGDPIHLKLRIVFTDTTQVTKKPHAGIVSHHKQTTQFKKYPDKKLVDDESVLALGSARSRACYLLTKCNLAASWDIEREVVNDSGEAPYFPSSRESDNNNDCLATQLHRSGFRLKVVSVPTSRIDCLACSKRNATANNTTSPINPHLSPHHNLEHAKNASGRSELSNSRNNLVDSREHVARDSHVFEHFLHYRSEIKSSDLLLERQRASDYLDSPPNMTSDDDCNDYWKRTQARRLAAIFYISKKYNQTISAASKTVSLLMRNHYLPLYKPCHCSSMVRNFKTLNDSGSLLCSPCSCCKGTRTNEHRNLDRQIDDLYLPISASSKCCLSGDVSSDTICLCRCHCSDFSEVYKRRQKLLSRCDPEDASQNIAKSSSILSYDGFVHRDADDENLLESKQLKYDDDGDSDSDSDSDSENDDEDDGKSIDYDSAKSIDLLLASMGHQMGTKANNGATVDEGKPSWHKEHDQAFKKSRSVNTKVLRSESTGDQRTSWADTENTDPQLGVFNESCREWKKLESNYEICDSGQNVTGRCRCPESHGETLFVIMEKYAPISEKEPHEFTRASSDNPASFTTKSSASMIKANREDERELNETIIDSDVNDKKSDSRVTDIDEQMLPQQRQQESPYEPEHGVRCSSFSKPIDKFLGTLSSGDDHDTNGSLLSSGQEPALRREATTFVTNNNQELEKERQDKRSHSSRNEYNAQSDQLEDPTIRDKDDSIGTSQRQQKSQQSQLLKQQRLRQLQSLQINEDVKDHAAVAGTIEQRPHVELEYSILLTVIVIDVFNRTVQMKPDLNKLIMLDLRALIAPHDATCDFVSGVVNLHMTNNSDSMQARQSHFDRLFYHVESVDSTDVMNALENHVETVRHRLGLIRKVDKFGLNLGMISPTKVQRSQLEKDDIASFLIPTNGSVIVKLNLAIHYVQGLPSDCNNIHVKYKLFSRYNKRWSIARRYNDASQCVTTSTNQSGAEGDGRLETIRRLKSSKSSPQHEPRHGDSCGNDDKSEHSNDNSLILLLQGSTVTSRPNNNDCFHLCCTEKISLELSRREMNIATQYGDSFFGSERERRRDDMTERRATLNDDVEQKSHQLTDEKNQSGLSKSIGDFPPIVEQFSNSPLTKEQSTSAAMIADDDKEPNKTISIELADNEESLKTCARCLQTKNTCLCGRETLNSNLAKRLHDAHSELFPGDSDDSYKLVLVFEIYSSDFYGDKLQGWSFTDVPINVSRSSVMNTDNVYLKLLPQANGTLSLDGASAPMDRDSGLSDECSHTHFELPVIRPTFCAPMDRLRYYLLGEVPKTTPKIESFVSSNNRYMMQTQQSGKLVLDYEVLRQFSDLTLDSALSDLCRSESKSLK